MELALQFKDNDTAHEDLILRFAGDSWDCDSYYLALDPELIPEREDADKVRVVLRRLLGQWRTAVEAIPDEGTVYLPYDFSDEYTGWLRCERVDVDVNVCRGWASIEGWSLAPSSIGKYVTDLPGFHPEGPTVRVGLGELVDAINPSIAQVE